MGVAGRNQETVTFLLATLLASLDSGIEFVLSAVCLIVQVPEDAGFQTRLISDEAPTANEVTVFVPISCGDVPENNASNFTVKLPAFALPMFLTTPLIVVFWPFDGAGLKVMAELFIVKSGCDAEATVNVFTPDVFVAVEDSYSKKQVLDIKNYCKEVVVLPRQAERTSTSKMVEHAVKKHLDQMYELLSRRV